MPKEIFKYLSCLSTVVLLIQAPVLADSSDEILRKLQQMEAEITQLKAELNNLKQEKEATEPIPADRSTSTTSQISEDQFRPSSKADTALASKTKESSPVLDLGQFGLTYRSDGYKLDTLRFGAYGESIFGRVDSGDGWENGFDANRVVLLGTYQISDDIFFNTEIEFEHGGIAFDEDDKLGGAIEVEQVFIDFRVNDYFTWRSPGIDIVPVGYVNLYHEPTQFYSAQRPEIYDGLIPSTWFAPSTGAYGKIIDGLYYQFQISAALEDTVNTEAGDPNSAEPYGAGISGSEALGLARAPIGDRSQQGDNLAYTTRLSYTPSIIPGLSGSTSLYYTDDTTPRNAYGTNANGSRRPLGKSNLTMFDTEFRYRIPKSGIELRSEYVRVDFGNPDNLRANNDIDPTNGVGDYMSGYSLEAAYHYDLVSVGKNRWEIVPFYRYSSIDLQNSGAKGSDLNAPSGAGSRKYHTVGAALFPTPKVVIKADYQLMTDDDDQTSHVNSFLGAVGFFF